MLVQIIGITKAGDNETKSGEEKIVKNNSYGLLNFCITTKK